MNKLIIKNLHKNLLIFTLCTLAHTSKTDDFTISNNSIPLRAQTADITKRLLVHTPYHEDATETWALDINVQPFFSRNVSQTEIQDNLGTRLLWTKTNTINFATNNFLGVNKGTMSVDPSVKAFGTHLHFLLTSNPSEPGLFFNVSTTCGAMHTNPNITFSSDTAATDVKTLTEFFDGTAPKSPSTQKALLYGLLTGKESSGFTLGDINLTAGYNIIQEDQTQLGVGVLATFGTAGDATAKQALEPLFGNSNRFGLGLQVVGHNTLYDRNEHTVSVHAGANMQHLFKTKMVKTYDLKKTSTTGKVGGAGSKYQLICSAQNSTTKDLPVANISSVDTQSAIPFVADIAAALTYQHAQWSCTLGYNFYGQSSESLVISKDTPLSIAYLYNSTTLYQQSDIDVASATQSALVLSKIFAEVAYDFTQTSYKPYIGLSASYEVSHVQNNAIPMYSIWLSGGLTF